MQKDKFLVKINESFIQALGIKCDFNNVIKAIHKQELSLFSQHLESNLSFFEEINSLIDKMMNIVYHPHFQTTTNEVVLRSEISLSLNQESFIKTTNDPSLWKQKPNKEMYPEYVHSIEHIDTLNIYENRALIYVYEQILAFLENYKRQTITQNSSIQEFYKQKGLVFAKHNIVDDLLKNKKRIAEFIQGDEEKIAETNTFLKVYKKAKRIKLTSFYKLLHHEKIALPLMPTNILIHDLNYNSIYRFYKKYLVVKTEKDGTTYEELANYIFIRLIDDLITSKYKFNKFSKIKINQLILHPTKPFVCRKDGFRYSIDYQFPNIDVCVSYNKSALAFHRLTIRDKLSNYSFIDDRDINTFYITLNNECDQYFNVVDININKQNNDDHIFDNLFKSMRVNIPYKNDKVERCPVCGGMRLQKDKNYYYCDNCGSKLAKLKIKSKPSLWIQSLWRY